MVLVYYLWQRLKMFDTLMAYEDVHIKHDAVNGVQMGLTETLFIPSGCPRASKSGTYALNPIHEPLHYIYSSANLSVVRQK